MFKPLKVVVKQWFEQEREMSRFVDKADLFNEFLDKLEDQLALLKVKATKGELSMHERRLKEASETRLLAFARKKH